MKRITLVALVFAASACSKSQTAPAPAPMHEGHMGSAGADKNAKPPAQVGFDGMPPLGTKAWCPVSKETFTVNAKTKSSTHNGKTYVFCCPDCKPEFDENPAKFVN